MTFAPSDAAVGQPEGGPWEDDVIELRVIRVLQPGDRSKRSAETEFLATALEFRFSIHLKSSGVRVGRIHLRITDDPAIVDRLGHAGYAVDPSHRRRGYATRAIGILLNVARAHDLKALVVLVEPTNMPSRRALERVEFELTGVVDQGQDAVALGLNPQLCRYELKL